MTKKEKLHKFFEISGNFDHVKAKIQQTITSLAEGIGSMFGENMKPFAENINSTIDLKWQNYLDSIVSAYNEELTEEEIDHVLAFHSSPLGQSYALKNRILKYRVDDIATQWFNALEKDVMGDLLKKLTDELTTPQATAKA